MAQRSKANFKSTKNTRFADNSTGDISAQDSRDMFEDVADSAMFLNDNFIDEDDFASDSATKAPSQQSVKAYVDSVLAASGVTQGTYTPTITNNTNVTSSVARNAWYFRIGSRVIVYARIDVTPTAAGDAQTRILITLPVASEIGEFDVMGSGSAIGGAGSPVAATVGSFPGNRAAIDFPAKSVLSVNLFVNFSYLITET